MSGMKVTKTAQVHTNGSLTLDDLRQLVQATTDWDQRTRVAIEQDLGQRDPYTKVTVTEGHLK